MWHVLGQRGRKFLPLMIPFLLVFVTVIAWLWRWQKSQPLHLVWCRRLNDRVFSLAFSPDEQFLACGSVGAIYLWQVKDGTLKSVLTGDPGGTMHSIAFSPDGKLLASSEALFMVFGGFGSQINFLKLWRVSNGSLRTMLKERIQGDNPAFSSDGKILASSSGLEVNLWRIENDHLVMVRKFTGHIGWVTSIAFSPDGVFLASGSADETIKLWRVRDGSLVYTLKGHDSITSVTFSPNGQFLASESENGTIKLWRVKSGSLIWTLRGHRGKVWVAFSPDGQYLFSGGRGGTIRLRRTIDGKSIWTYKLPAALCVTFSRSGGFLAAGDENGFIRTYAIAER